MEIHGTIRQRFSHTARRAGLTLFEVIVTLGILAVIAVPITLNIASSSRLGGESARFDEAAIVLARLADQASRYSGTQGASSFSQVMLPVNGGTNPSRLSQLTTKLIDPELNSCGGAIASEANWKGPFFNVLIPKTGLQIAEGFFAEDLLVRYNLAGVAEVFPPAPASPASNVNTTEPATLAIIMNNVSRSDALGLQSRIEGTSTETSGTVRFPPTGDPVTVRYHFSVHGC